MTQKQLKLGRSIYLAFFLIVCLSNFNPTSSQLTTTTGSQDGLEKSVSLELERTIDLDNDDHDGSTNENNLIDTIEETEEGEEAPQENSEEDGKKKDNDKFSWNYHQEDHGVYSGRSLMSTANIKHQDEASSESDTNDDDPHLSSHKKKDQHEYLDPLKTIDYAEKEWQLMFRSFDQAYDSMASSILHQLGKQTNLFDEVVSRLRPACRRDIMHIRHSAAKHKLWALRMLDSNGKLPSGITYGRFSSPGDYEECLSVRVDETVMVPSPTTTTTTTKHTKLVPGGHHKFHGKYCLIDFRLPLPERPRDKLLSIHEPVLNLTGTTLSEMYPEIMNYSAYASVFYEVGYMHAFCLPSTCDVMDVAKSMGRALEGMHLIVNNTVDCQEEPDEPLPLRKSQIISLYLLAILFVNVSCASLAHWMLPKEAKQQPTGRRPSMAPVTAGQTLKDDGGLKMDDHDKANHLKELEANQRRHFSLMTWLRETSAQNRFYADCFSIQKNFERLTKPDPRGLTFVHYTRIVAMALTVITHTAGLGTLQAITKPADASNSEQIFRDLIPQMLANAFTSIQIFFFMAGFMLVISTYPSIKRDRGHVSFLEYAIKRAIRLMPGLAATICLNFLWPLVVDGPMLSYFIRIIVEPCEVNWWRTLGFLSNFDHVEKMCLRHSYFSASDYQLHIMAFPLLILLYKQPTLSLIMAAILTLGGFVAQVIMVLTKTVMPFMMVDYIDKEAFFNVVHYIHHPVWNHMSAFFYGFIIGYLVVKQIRVELSPKTIKRTWLVLMPAGIVSIFAPYFWNHYKRPIYRWQMVLYVIFDRFILLTTCAWLSYATMVLARKPTKQARRPSVAPPPPPSVSKDLQAGIQLNLPHIVTLEPQDNKVAAVGQTADRLRPSGGSQTSIPRQRSSPNFQNLQNIDNLPETRPKLGKATSSMNLAESLNTISEQQVPVTFKEHSTQAGKGEAPHPTDAAKPSQQQQQQQARKSSPPINNVNTLCLVLSRLTFQLYLFNMVVLWVDVNHSKYFWFFSYYFIITKAFAIYICSAIMAMIFFITLESPSLTLYIAWVKSRAAARAKRQPSSSRNNNDHQQQAKTFHTLPPIELVQGKKTTTATANQEVAGQTNQPEIKLSPGSSASGKSNLAGSFDGLCMRMGTPDPAQKPTFSFIDLSAAARQPDGEKQTSNNQTKM